MSSTTRRERERLETRELILDAARALFAKLGYEAVSLRKIAEAIEYTPAAIYVHFADKESLFRELAAEDFGKLAQAMPAAAAIADPLERIAMIGERYIAFGLAHPNHYQLMFMTAATKCGELSADQLAKRGNPAEDAYAFLKLTIAEAIEKRLLRPELTNADLVAQTMWAGVHGVTSLQVIMGGDPWIDWASTDARVRNMVWTLVRGIARKPAAYPGARTSSSASNSSVNSKKIRQMPTKTSAFPGGAS